MDACGEPIDTNLEIEEYYRAYGQAVRGLCARLTGSSDLGDELAQETFVRALKSLRKDPRLNESPLAWLLTIARNLCTDHWRKRGLGPRISMLPNDELEDATGFGRPGVDRDQVVDQVVATEQAQRVRPALVAAVRSLRPIERKIFLLHEEEDWSFEAIARSEGATVDSVRNLAFRARGKLKRALSRDLLVPGLAFSARVRDALRRLFGRLGVKTGRMSSASLAGGTMLALVFGTLTLFPVIHHPTAPRSVDTAPAFDESRRGVPTDFPSPRATGSRFSAPPPARPNGPVTFVVDPGLPRDHAATPSRSRIRVTVRDLDGSEVFGNELGAGCFDHPSVSLPSWSPVWTSC